MQLFLLFSVLVVPVVLLASPVVLFAIKGRPDIARLYIICLLLIQAAIVVSYWGNIQQAAAWVLLLVGVSQLLGCGFTWHKTREAQWLKYGAILLVINGLLFTLGYQYSAITL